MRNIKRKFLVAVSAAALVLTGDEVTFCTALQRCVDLKGKKR